MNSQTQGRSMRASIVCAALAAALGGCGGGRGDDGGAAPQPQGGLPPPTSAGSSDAGFVSFEAGQAMALSAAAAPFDLTAFVQPPPAADDTAAIATPSDQAPGGS
jgi:hypothetical protein